MAAPVPCRVLPLSEVEAADQAARALYSCTVGDDGETFGEMRRQAEVLAAALGASPEDLLEGCVPAELALAYQRWEAIQIEAIPQAGELRAALKWAMHKDGARYFDGLAAYSAETADRYYGQPTADLTVGQLEYFLLLREAFRTEHVEGKDKLISKEWLSRED